ncbi:MAG TPA: ABC transporter permease [Steroidobacteraceae bacterium]|jgi:putative ABC transport system permease protein|nr:ABC transporter permease [Steroidobacteraceae bacterium]
MLATLLTLLTAIIAAALLSFAPGALLALVLVLFLLWLAITRVGRQTWSVAQVGILTIPQRLGSSLVVVIGIAGVVGVLVAVLAMAEGFQAILKETGSDDSAIVMRAGSQTELNSVLDHDAIALIGQMPQVQRDSADVPIASPEIVVVAALPKKATGLDANVEIRGIGERAWPLHPKLKLTAGRKFNPGLRELVVGKGAHAQFAGLDVGANIKLGGQLWTVVGTFESGDAYDSELWGDFDVVGPAYHRGSTATSVTVRLTDPSAFDAFKAEIANDHRLKVDAKTTRAYYTDQSSRLSTGIRWLGFIVGTIMALGAVFGALNSMYAAVATRTREIATLRALGFRGLPVIVSILIETMLLAVAGGALGAAIAWLLFDNYTASTLGDNFSQVVFTFRVSPSLLWTGLKWALTIGFIGGLFPAVRAARMRVTDGLREL